LLPPECNRHEKRAGNRARASLAPTCTGEACPRPLKNPYFIAFYECCYSLPHNHFFVKNNVRFGCAYDFCAARGLATARVATTFLSLKSSGKRHGDRKGRHYISSPQVKGQEAWRPQGSPLHFFPSSQGARGLATARVATTFLPLKSRITAH